MIFYVYFVLNVLTNKQIKVQKKHMLLVKIKVKKKHMIKVQKKQMLLVMVKVNQKKQMINVQKKNMKQQLKYGRNVNFDAKDILPTPKRSTCEKISNNKRQETN